MKAIAVRLGTGHPVSIDLDDAGYVAICDAAEECGMGVSAWAAHVLDGRAPEGLGLSRRAGCRELLLAAAGVSDIARQARHARRRHLAAVKP